MLTMSCSMRDDVESLEYVVGNAYCLDILDWMGYIGCGHQRNDNLELACFLPAAAPHSSGGNHHLSAAPSLTFVPLELPSLEFSNLQENRLCAHGRVY